MKKTVKIIFTIIAALIGAGFASGKEIYSFFFIYGIKGILGIFISSFLISLTICQVLKLCYKLDINTYTEFYTYIIEHIFPKKDNNSITKITNFIIALVNSFLLISFYIMIAGFSSFLNQEFNINKIMGSILIVFFCYLAFQHNISFLIKISNYIIPVFIIFLLFCSFQNINFIENYANISLFTKQDVSVFPIIKAVLYGCYNCVLLIPLLITLKKYINNNSTIYSASIFIFIIIALLSICVFNILLLGNSKIFSLDMPLIEIIKKYGNVISIIYLIMIGSSIYTTAISTGCAFLNGCNLKNIKRNSILICSSAIVLSQISFSVLVELLYPVLGIVGFLEILGIFGVVILEKFWKIWGHP